MNNKEPDIRKITKEEYKILENIKPSKLLRPDGSEIKRAEVYKHYNGRTYMISKGISVGYKVEVKEKENWVNETQVFKEQ